MQKVKVWDLPTRIFHWLMTVLLVLLWLTAEFGEMQWHQVIAYGLMVLVAFRLIWGLIGSETSRFSQFVLHPKHVIKYGLTNPKPVSLGHNPLGGYMVVVLLSLLMLQMGTGLFSTDEIFSEGPLTYLVSSDTTNWLTWLHKTNFNVIFFMVILHVLAVLVHWLKGDNLIAAMFSGYKKMMPPNEVSQLKFVSPLKAAVIALIVFAGVWLLFLKQAIDYL